MKKSLFLSVSAAALMVAVSAHAGDGVIGQAQDFHVVNAQYQDQGALTSGEAGSAYAKAEGGDGGSGSAPSGKNHYNSLWSQKGGSGNGSSGGDGGSAKAAGQGGDAFAKAFQDQGQKQLVAGSQQQIVHLPDITVTVPGGNGDGTGGAAGPGASNAATVDGENNDVQSVDADDNDDVAIASLGSAAVRGNGNVQMLGDDATYNRDSFNVTMKNYTDMKGINRLDDITLTSGDSDAGFTKGGSVDVNVVAVPDQKAIGGDAFTQTYGTKGGDGDKGGSALSVNANVGLQEALSYDKSTGGDGKAFSDSLGASAALAGAKADSDSFAKNHGWAKNDVDADATAGAGGGSSPVSKLWSFGHKDSGSGSGKSLANAGAGGSSKLLQDAGAGSKADALAPAESLAASSSEALAAGGDGGDIHSKTGNSSKQDGIAKASAGNGGNGGDATVATDSTGGDAINLALADQTVNAATGATVGGVGGDSSVSFSTGSLGNINLGTLSGISTIAQNTGLNANQFTSFSINAHTTF